MKSKLVIVALLSFSALTSYAESKRCFRLDSGFKICTGDDVYMYPLLDIPMFPYTSTVVQLVNRHEAIVNTLGSESRLDPVKDLAMTSGCMKIANKSNDRVCPNDRVIADNIPGVSKYVRGIFSSGAIVIEVTDCGNDERCKKDEILKISVEHWSFPE